jgi:lipopolysaccharide biosynthesis glycosyltransferase
MQPKTNTASCSDVCLVTGADDNFAMPLAVTVRSSLERLDPNRRLNVFILDGGLSDESKARLLASWTDSRVTVQWLRPDLDLIRDLPVSHHIKVATYLRLLMPALVPPDVSRVIYLDADTLVRRNLGDLWDEPQGPHAVLAVQDLVAPVFDADIALPNYARCRRHMCTPTPIPNYRQLGLPPYAKYFNGGMLVVDLAQWRRENFAEQMLNCLRTHREHVVWWDQYALNVVLAGKWRQLDCRWNQGAHLFVYPAWQESPLDRNTFLRLRNDPWIVHFCSPSKPWQYFCQHPFTAEFRRCLKQTEWKNWLPEPPQHYVKEWWDYHYLPLRSRFKANIRIARHAIRANRRQAA